MQKAPHLHDTYKPGKMMLHFNFDRFTLHLLRVTFIIMLLLASTFADGIVLRNGMQMVVTIRDTSGDSISIQEGIWQAKIAKSQVASFWYNGKQYSYMKKFSAKPYSSSIESQPGKTLNQPGITTPINHDSCITSQKSENNIDSSQKKDNLLTSTTTSGQKNFHKVSFDQAPPEAKIPENDGNSTINIITERDTAIASEEDLLPLPDTALLKDLDLNDYDTAPDKSAELELLFDPEYTNDELVRKKRVFKILLTAGCAMGATSTTFFIVSNDWEMQFFAVPFMIASIPLTTVGTVKSIEYRRRLRAAEYKKQRAQMSLSLQIPKANLLITF